jgi:hypothetical protein
MITKSIEMAHSAAETVRGVFGFDRRAYSNFKRNNGRRKWRWYEELREQNKRHGE